MQSKHTLWQARWDIDQAEGLAIHDSGLRVRLASAVVVAENVEDMVQVIAAKHGAHNAAAMVQRLVREGEQLLIDPNSRGWRGKDRRE